MAKEIWLGPLLGNNRSRLIERCAELASQNKASTFLYLTASQPLLQIVTQGILDGDHNRGVWGELPVYLFRGFVRRLLSTALDEAGQPLAPRAPIDQEELPAKRSLVSQILTRLLATGELQALATMAQREGCVNSIATLIGEIQRAAKTPAEVQAIISERGHDLNDRSEPNSTNQSRGADRPFQIGKSFRQTDFDREVALIYSTYCALLEKHQLTESDADQLLALSILKGNNAAGKFQIPFLRDMQLLVLDGFFDFTPVQGEVLRQLIPAVPEVIVNLNHDERNSEIFLPFRDTIEHLLSVADFETQTHSEETVAPHGALSGLRQHLFNPSAPEQGPPLVAAGEHEVTLAQSQIRYCECGDRETEIRFIAKEIKRLVLSEGYQLADIALVVRQRASYAETITRVMREESLPCNLELRVEATDIPGMRAAVKLFDVLEAIAREPLSAPKLSRLADLIKSEYFRLNEAALRLLAARFDAEHANLFDSDQLSGQTAEAAREYQKLKERHGIGRWDADALENTFAYVGSELRVNDWLKRASRLIKELPAAMATKELLNIDTGEQQRDPDEADQIENAETAKLEEKDVEKKRRPSRDIHPAAIAWAALVVEEFSSAIRAVPQKGQPAELRAALMQLLDRFCFRARIISPVRDVIEDRELPQAMLNFNSLEALRRAFVAAVKSITIAGLSVPPALAGGSLVGLTVGEVERPAHAGGTDKRELNRDERPPAHAGGSETKLATFISEVRRALSSQSLVFHAGDERGLPVLEATDVRGLRFRAVFIAGLVEGGFPLRAGRDWIYPHEERERLKNYGLTLEDISPATLLKEEHYFYQAACRATERLYLSRPLVLADDSETVASYYLDELRRAIAPFEITAEIVRRDYDGQKLSEISRPGELSTALVRQQERHFHRGEKSELLYAARIVRLLTLARNDGFLSGSALRRIEIERERAGKVFGPYDGEITDPQLIALLQRRFGSDFLHSASGLSLYGNCAYRFFGQRILKLEPRGEAALDLQALDAGKLLHDILRRFFERRRRRPLNEISRNLLLDELRKLADDVFDEHERVVPPLNKQIWKIDREIRKVLLDQVLLYELEIQEKAAAAGVVPAYFEIAFGGTGSAARDPASTNEPLELTRATFVGADTMKISGQIDRVDVANDNTLIAYDYKLSTGSSKEDIRSGRSLQLPIYLEALEKLILPDHRIAGGGYYVIRGTSDRRNKGLHRKSELHYSGIGSRAGAVISDDEWTQIRTEVIARIWDFLDHIRAGEFHLDPSEKQKTCRFCDFAPVCRYDRYRIDGKKRNEATG